MRPKFLSAAVGHALHRVGVGDVREPRQRLAARRLDLLDHGCRPRPCCARTLTTTAAPADGQRQRHRAADVAARAGDDGDAAAEFLIAHCLIPVVGPIDSVLQTVRSGASVQRLSPLAPHRSQPP